MAQNPIKTIKLAFFLWIIELQSLLNGYIILLNCPIDAFELWNEFNNLFPSNLSFQGQLVLTSLASKIRRIFSEIGAQSSMLSCLEIF